jgi:ABC-type sugar transport system ATPase subunit
MLWPSLELVLGFGAVITLLVGGHEVVAHNQNPATGISVGQFAAFSVYIVQMFWPMIALGYVVNLFERGTASVLRIDELLKQQPEIADTPGAESRPIAGSISFRNLSFAYPTAAAIGPEVLHNISLDIPAGSSLAIVGPTGAGKSTLVSLIPRLYDAPEGSVLIDGRPVRAFTLEDLRRNIGFVPQETFLFSSTIAENIAFGRPDATAPEILEAATTAHIADEILEFPRAHPYPRRRPRLRRHLHRRADPLRPARGHARTDDHLYLAPHLHRAQRRPHRRAGRRAHRRTGHARRTDRAQRLLHRARREAAARGRAGGHRLKPRATITALRESNPGAMPPRRPRFRPTDIILIAACFFALRSGHAQPPAPASADRPLPDVPALMRNVEANQRKAEAVEKDYIYHSVTSEEKLDSHGNVKKTQVVEADNFWLDGVPVTRVVKRDGKPLSADELAKEDRKLDEEAQKAREHRAQADEKGKETDPRGEDLVTVSRLMELGAFLHPRRVQLNGRDTIAVDFSGDPQAKTHDRMEEVIRDMAGTAWVDEQDQMLVRAEGHFVETFKVGGGLLADIRKGTRFTMQMTKVNGEVWLPAMIDGEGAARVLLFWNFDGRLHVSYADYRKFRASSTVLPAEVPPAPAATPRADLPSGASAPTATPQSQP